MSTLLQALRARADAGRPVGVGLIGAGVFGTLFARQAARSGLLRLAVVCDLDAQRAGAAAGGGALVEREAAAAWEHPDVEVVVEATGDPIAAARHALAAMAAGRHVVNATVEADALLGPTLARHAERHGVVYSFAYGDQPALICELVDWARLNGFEVVCAGKGTKFLPAYRAVTPDNVWAHYGLSAERVRAGGYDARMFTSFLDGTKSAIEMAAVANATGLRAPAGGLRFPPAGADELAAVCRPARDGGALDAAGTVEVVSSVRRDGAAIARDLRWGVFVVIVAGDEQTRAAFADYGLATDDSGRFAALHRPSHLVGMETATSVASAALRGEATGAPAGFVADVAAVAKRALPPGSLLDGEGGYATRGRLLGALEAAEEDALPIALARGVRTTAYIGAGDVVRWADVEPHPAQDIVALRRALEARPPPEGALEPGRQPALA